MKTNYEVVVRTECRWRQDLIDLKPIRNRQNPSQLEGFSRFLVDWSFFFTQLFSFETFKSLQRGSLAMTMRLVPEYSALPLEFTVVKLEGKTYPDRPEEHSEVSTWFANQLTSNLEDIHDLCEIKWSRSVVSENHVMLLPGTAHFVKEAWLCKWLMFKCPNVLFEFDDASH